MKFKFIGSEPSDFMGFQWYPGSEHDVTDEHAIRKLGNSVLFETVDADASDEPKKRGKKPVQPVSENGDDANGA